MTTNAQLTADVTLPSGMEIETGSPFAKIWRLKNSGGQNWQDVRLMNLSGTIPTAVNWHPVPATAPNGETDLKLSLAAPPQPGSYTSQWQLHNSAGQPFGPPLTVQIQAIPGGANNGRLISYSTTTTDGSGTAQTGQTFSHTLLLENTGGRRWRADYQLTYLGGDAQPAQPSYPLPATIPGEMNSVTITLTAPATGGTAVTFWQLRDEKGVAFGGFIAPELPITAPVVVAPPFNPTAWRTVIWDITGIFESGKPGGNPAAYQNKDSGIVSYGAHQVTLASGNLGRVLTIFFQKSNSAASQALQQEFMGRVQDKNQHEGLRNDGRFRDLLIQAANEPAMIAAQDDIFGEGFYIPAVAEAQKLGIQTPLGVACIYDTRIQHGAGGSTFLFGLTKDKAGGNIGQNGLTEAAWLAVFLDEREALLHRLANKAEQNGDANSGRFLRNSTFRVQELRTLLQANNLGLTGQFTVRGFKLTGL